MISVFGSKVSPTLTSSLRGGHARRRVPGRRGQDLGPQGVARDGLLVLERHGAVLLLERLPAADGGRPAAEGDLLIAARRVQRQRRAVGDRRLPLLVSVLVELRPRQDHVAAIDLRAQLHLGAVVRRRRRQLDRDGRRAAAPVPSRRLARASSFPRRRRRRQRAREHGLR